MSLIDKASDFRTRLEAMAQAVDDETALAYPEMFPSWSSGVTYPAGTRVYYQGVLYTVLQGHTSQSDWAPGAAPSLFSKVLTGTGGEILEWTQPDSTNPYMTGDKVLFEGTVYISLIDNNVWSPSAYPAGWEAVTE